MMILAADTSFLFSLFGKDSWTEKAREMSRRWKEPLQICVFNSLELTNAALQAEFAGHLEPGLGNLIVARFQGDIDSGRLVHPTFNPGKAVARATELSRKHALTGGHRTYDVLLVAAALEMKATDFFTFDSRQAKLAKSEGLRVKGV